MFTKVLIANRGEIALRIIRACNELGIRTVAVHSEADVDSLHVRFADEAICIGPAQSAQSYLNIAHIISAAEVSDAEAIHPGYGFLAEDAQFAEICEECSITFIGPEPNAIRLMGNKSQAKETMLKADVPVIPGSEGVIKSIAEAQKEARHIGYPIMIKAAAGGGGRGMRIVKSPGDLAEAFPMAQIEAEKAFGNADLYLEKFILSPKHIEFQILADNYGNTLYLGERDCSIQRRHQKLIEETPSVVMDEGLRKKMGEAAVRAARAVGYNSAGTVEFLLDRDGNFYFMEMNTRIQVEHPITEEVTRLDIVKEQIKIAAGETLSIHQEDVRMSGHSIECRINAEDCENDFRPTPGKITAIHIPGGMGVRVDTHVYTEYIVPPYYDSLIAKLIVWGGDRDEAITRMKRALGEFVVEGIKTSVPFHLRVINSPEFVSGNYGTDFIEKHFNLKLNV